MTARANRNIEMTVVIVSTMESVEGKLEAANAE